MTLRWKIILYILLGLFLLGLGLSIWWSVARVTAYRDFLNYRPDQDYRYDFSQTDAVQVPVAVSEKGFVWPHLTQPWDTAFLELRVEDSLPLPLFDPGLKASLGKARARQYFERGVSGLRYLNLSPLREAHPRAGQAVKLQGKHLSWPRQKARLLLFQTQVSRQARVLVVAPHPDDAEIAAFGLYSYRNSYIVTLTAGEAGGDYYEPYQESKRRRHLRKGKLRVWDSMTVPYWGGLHLDRVCNLGYFDATLEQMHRNPDREAVSSSAQPANMRQFRRCEWAFLNLEKNPRPTWRHLVEDLAEILRGLKPDVIVAPHPLLDRHPDHRYAGLALFQAIARAKLTQGQLLLYTNHDILSEMYPFGPDEGLVSLPPWFQRSWFFTSLYSHQIGLETQSDKYFALEAMHDLRSPGEECESSWDLLSQGWERLVDEALGLEQATSYFRRAVRPNELFFVIPAAQAGRLAEISQKALE